MELLKCLIAIVAIIALFVVVGFIISALQMAIVGKAGGVGFVGIIIWVGIMIFLSPKIWKKITKK
jgi:hypothetical protein